ncbi:MAG: hypothetical protein P4L35_12845 [Ignavibacteriaceae bacterium]|nr:hypothetical protein [Ignavibacteriaceae bacterium]
MGIISTGLGFTTTTGTIFQTFTIDNNQFTLIINWNFLSEEFLEFISLEYQDYFKVVINTSNGLEHVLMNKAIDKIAVEEKAGYPLLYRGISFMFHQILFLTSKKFI